MRKNLKLYERHISAPSGEEKKTKLSTQKAHQLHAYMQAPIKAL